VNNPVNENSQNPLSVLITGVGAPGTRGTIYSLRHNSESRPIRIVGVDSHDNNAGRFMVDRFHRIPHGDDPSYVDSLALICSEERIEVVIPQTTREVEVLSRARDALSAMGLRVMVSSSPAIQVANNKWKLLKAFEQMGLPVPANVLVSSEQALRKAARDFGYPQKPVVIKPPSLNGMRGVRILKTNGWDLRRFLSEKPSGLEVCLEDLVDILRHGDFWPDLLVTEYLPGPEYSVDVFAGSKTHLAIPRLRCAIRSGITFESTLDYHPDLTKFSIQAATHLGLQYAVGFQFKLDDRGVPKVIECNPRIQGTMVASVFSGANVIWMSVRELLGDAPTQPSAPLKPGSFYRFFGGIAVCSCGDSIDEI
jgi:carbamoyl-phosphate synthase large subunit